MTLRIISFISYHYLYHSQISYDLSNVETNCWSIHPRLAIKAWVLSYDQDYQLLADSSREGEWKRTTDGSNPFKQSFHSRQKKLSESFGIKENFRIIVFKKLKEAVRNKCRKFSF